MVHDPPIFAASPVFDDARAELTGTVDFPVRLPSAWWQYGAEPAALHTTTAADATGYTVTLSSAEYCPGSTVCAFAMSEARSANHEWGFWDVEGPGSTQVPLPGGATGWFRDMTCGASCSQGWIVWTEGEVQYQVGIKASSVEKVLPLAWSAIDPDADYPIEAPSECSDAAVPNLDGSEQAEIVVGPFLTWLVWCTEDWGPSVNVVPHDATVRWRHVGGLDWSEPGDQELLVGDGSATWFFVGTGPFIDVDSGNGGRLSIRDPRCGDIDGDGADELVDATSSEVIVFPGRMFIHREAVDPAIVGALPSC